MKLVELVAKRADISDDLFHYHWNAIHGPLARRVTSVRRYIQHHRIYESLPGLPPLSCQGVLEGWFDDEQALESVATDPAYTDAGQLHDAIQVSLRDARPMVARSRTYRERSDAQAAASIVLCVTRRPDVPGLAFESLWREHAEMCLDTRHVLRYVQNDVVTDETQAGYSAVSFMTFNDVFMLEEAWAAAGAELIAHLSRFALPSACAAHVSHERRVVWP